MWSLAEFFGGSGWGILSFADRRDKKQYSHSNVDEVKESKFCRPIQWNKIKMSFNQLYEFIKHYSQIVI